MRFHTPGRRRGVGSLQRAAIARNFFCLSYAVCITTFLGAHSIFRGKKARAEGRGGHNEPLADGGWDVECVYLHIAMI